MSEVLELLSESRNLLAVPCAVPASMRACLGPPPLMPGEDRAGYDALLAQVARAMSPADVFEEIWVRDVVDLSWQVLRLRRLKASLMSALAHEGVRDVLYEREVARYAEVARAWARRDASAVAQVD